MTIAKKVAKFAQPTSVVFLLSHLLLVVLGMWLYSIGSEWWKAVGSSVTAAGCTGVAVFAYVLLSDDTATRLKAFNAVGLANCFAGRSVLIREEYDRRLKQASEAIDIMGFGLASLRQDYEAMFPQWAMACRVRILLIDPEFPAHNIALSDRRDLEESNPEGSIRDDVRAFIATARRLAANERFQVRLYRCLPTVNVFRVDDELFFGPYLMGRQSRNTPTFVCKRGGVLFDAMLDHFEQIWNSDIYSRPVLQIGDDDLGR